MPDIRPFKGILYNPQKIDDISRVITEPYDVISPAQRDAYYRAHPCNIVHLILGKEHSGDNSRNNQYTRAKRDFDSWLKKDILHRDEQESIYIYTQSFYLNNKLRTRTGFFVLMRLEDFGRNTVLPHENTFSHPVQDRMKLLQAVGANLSPVFALFVDPQAGVNRILSAQKRGHRPVFSVEKDAVVHRIWRVSDKKAIARIQEQLKERKIFIADGHHRYEAALNFRNKMRRKDSDACAAFNYVMTCLVATADPGLAILPTHRAVRRRAAFHLEETLRQLKQYFRLKSYSGFDKLFSDMGRVDTPHIFGLYCGANRFYSLTLKNIASACKLLGKDRKALCADLDVAVLHSLIIEQIFKLGPLEGDICYSRDAEEIIRLVDKKEYQAGFFLRATTLKQVKRMASAGRKMPHKSTYFYPKLLTGLVIRELR